MRVASLVPAAAEIVCAIGARDALVGVSHECNWPRGLALPALTRARVHAPPTFTSAELDAAARARVRDAAAIHDVDDAARRRASPSPRPPDLIRLPS